MFSLFWQFKKERQAAEQPINFERLCSRLYPVFIRADWILRVITSGKQVRKQDLSTRFSDIMLNISLNPQPTMSFKKGINLRDTKN